MHTGRRPHENKDRDRGDVAEVKETSKIASKQQKLGKTPGTDSPSHLPDGTNPMDSLVSEF